MRFLLSVGMTGALGLEKARFLLSVGMTGALGLEKARFLLSVGMTVRCGSKKWMPKTALRFLASLQLYFDHRHPE